MEYLGGGGGRWRSPRGGGGGWQNNNSPRYRGGGQNFSPRFGGGGGRWQHRHHSSPYDPNFRHRSNFQSPHQQSGSPRFFSNPQRFNHPRHQNPADLSIDAWVSPAMWDDPWKYLIQKPGLPTTDVPEDVLSSTNAEVASTENLHGTSETMDDAETSVTTTCDDKLPEDIEKDAANEAFESDAGKDLLTLITS